MRSCASGGGRLTLPFAAFTFLQRATPDAQERIPTDLNKVIPDNQEREVRG